MFEALMNFYNINWTNFSIRQSPIRPDTYIINVERTNRMLDSNEIPVFFIREESYANTNQKHCLKDLAICDFK